MFFVAYTPQKVDNIHQQICFEYFCISFTQIKSEVILIAVNAISLVHFCQSSLVSN